MENLLPNIIQIAELVGSAILGGWVYRIFTIRERVKQEKADTKKKEQEAKAESIENVKKVFLELYQPVLDDLENRLEKMGDKVNTVEAENESLKKEIAEVREENARLKAENDELRDALREIRPDIVPSRRSANAKRQARSGNGQFVKKEED